MWEQCCFKGAYCIFWLQSTNIQGFIFERRRMLTNEASQAALWAADATGVAARVVSISSPPRHITWPPLNPHLPRLFHAFIPWHSNPPFPITQHPAIGCPAIIVFYRFWLQSDCEISPVNGAAQADRSFTCINIAAREKKKLTLSPWSLFTPPSPHPALHHLLFTLNITLTVTELMASQRVNVDLAPSEPSVCGCVWVCLIFALMRYWVFL